MEENNSLSFLDILVFRNVDTLETSIYRKPTFSGIFFNSFIPTVYKHGLIYSLLFSCFPICSDYGRFHDEIVILKDIFDKNDYIFNVVNFCIRTFLTKIHRPKVEVFTVPKREIISRFCVLLP